MKISLKRKYAAVLPLILSIAVLLLLGCQAESQDGRSEFTDHAAELSRTKDAYNNKEEMPDDNPDYEVKYIELKDTQKNNILKKLSDVMEKCAPIYSQAADASSPGGVLAEDDIHRMADLIAQDKKAVICGSRDDNMRNYEEVDSAIRRGKAGKNAGAEFYSVNTNGIFRYYKLEFEKENLFSEIQKELEQKLDALVARELYTKYKTAPTEEEKEKARQEYLNKKGVHSSFRW